MTNAVAEMKTSNKIEHVLCKKLDTIFCWRIFLVLELFQLLAGTYWTLKWKVCRTLDVVHVVACRSQRVELNGVRSSSAGRTLFV